MIYMWPKHKPGQAQYIYFYQLRHPDLRRGYYMADLVKLVGGCHGQMS